MLRIRNLRRKPKYGSLVCLEGADGCGKSTTIEDLKPLLAKTDWDYVITKEPGGTPLGEKLREHLIDPDLKLSPCQVMKYFLWARRDHLRKVILPALKAHRLVICDRYVVSNMAYQGKYVFNTVKDNLLAFSNNKRELRASEPFFCSKSWSITPYNIMNKYIDVNGVLNRNLQMPEFVYPNLNVYLQAKPKYNIERLQGRKEKSDRFDKALNSVRNLKHLQWQFRCALRDIGTPCFVVNADRSAHVRARMIFERLRKLMHGEA